MKIGQFIAIIMMAVEMLGAFVFLRTKSTLKRVVLSSLALGFAYAIVIADILPDATENFQWGYLICIGAVGIMFLIEMGAKHFGNNAAAGAMAFHNFFEGLVVMSRPSISPMLVMGIVLHKFPEGMTTFSLLDHIKRDKVKFIIAAAIGLLIPIGTLCAVPEMISKPITAFAAGCMLYAISKSVKKIVVEHFETSAAVRKGMISAAMVGAIIGGISCLLV